MRQKDKTPSKKNRPSDDDIEEEFEEDDLEDDDEEEETGFMAWYHREMAWFDGFLVRWTVRLVIIGSHISIGLLACYLIVWHTGRGLIYDDIDKIPPRFVGLVLGCAKTVKGYKNQFFTARINAAAELYREGKLQFIIVSGDSDRGTEDEPLEMKEALIKKGVPANHIYCDNAGYRTLDSVLRAHRVFGQQEMTIISQHFHNTRALYIARRYGLEGCIAYDADDADSEWMIKVYFREIFARIMAVLDVEFLKTEPEVLGDEVHISEKSPPKDDET